MVKDTDWYMDWCGKAVRVSSIALWSQNGSCQTPQSCQFSNRSLFRSSPIVMNLEQWLKEGDLTCKRHRWDFCEEFAARRFATKCAAVKFVKPWMSIPSSEQQYHNYVDSANVSLIYRRKDCRGKFCWLHTQGGSAQSSSKSTTWRDNISDLAWSCLGVEHKNYLGFLVTVRCFESSWVAASANLLREKARILQGIKNDKTHDYAGPLRHSPK